LINNHLLTRVKKILTRAKVFVPLAHQHNGGTKCVSINLFQLLLACRFWRPVRLLLKL